jgi:hypothetical protein
MSRQILIFAMAIALALHANADQVVGTISGYGAGTANNKNAVVFKLAGQQPSGARAVDASTRTRGATNLLVSACAGLRHAELSRRRTVMTMFAS